MLFMPRRVHTQVSAGHHEEKATKLHTDKELSHCRSTVDDSAQIPFPLLKPVRKDIPSADRAARGAVSISMAPSPCKSVVLESAVAEKENEYQQTRPGESSFDPDAIGFKPN